MRKITCLIIVGLILGQLLVFEQAYGDSRAIIKSASEYDYPPFCVVSKDGKADGFSVELLREALSTVNLDVEFKTGQWDVIKKELSDGAIQVLPLVGRTPEREAIFDFTFSYLTLHGAVFVRKGDNRIKKASDLSDKTVLVMRGDNAEEFIRRTNLSSHIVTVNTYTEAMQLLEEGKYDAVITQRLMGLALLKKIKIKKVVPLDFVLNDFKQDLCFAVRKGDKALLSHLNEGLSLVITNGTYDRLQKKWFGPLLQGHITYKDVAKYALIVFVLTVAVMALLLIVMLRIEVKRKTNSLVQEIVERKRVENLIANNEERLRLAQRIALIGSWDWDIKEGTLNWSHEIYRQYDLEPNEVTPSYEEWTKFVHPDDLEDINSSVKQAIEENKPYSIDIRMISKKGREFNIRAEGTVYRDENGKAVRFIGTQQDITERKQAENALRESEVKLRTIFESSVDAIGISKNGIQLLMNRSYISLFGYSTADELINQPVLDLIAPSEHEIILERIKTHAKGEVPLSQYETRGRRKDGTEFDMDVHVSVYELGDEIYSLVIIRDITERKQMEEALRESENRYRELSILDDLTQLYNSRHFHHQLKMEIDRVNRYGHTLTLALLDIDDFKKFNDTYGHIEGDQVLLRVGKVIKRCLRQTDSAYRYGGEEFTILLPMTTDRDSVVTAERIRTEFKKERFSPSPGQEVNITVSIGFAQYKPQEDMKTFVNRVDQLMYQAKKNGKDRISHDLSL